MAESFSAQRLRPYHIHLAARFLPGCQNCFGFRCKRRCKLDGRSAGVDPALATGNAVLLDECEVRTFGATSDCVSHVRISRHGKELKLSARAYVLAAGGLSSPRLLLASQSAEWPKGIGNHNDLVGRFLMFHLMELVAVWPGKGSRSSGPSKALALRDFYFVDGQRFGIFQAMGIDASYGMIVDYLNGIFDRSLLRKLRPLRALTRIPAYIAAKVFGSAKMFSATIEDLPYRDNRVTLDPDDPDRLRFEYTLPQELRRRRDTFRHVLRRSIRGHRLAFLSVQPQLNFPHSCGTLRFGEDPATSVLDVNCRVHGVRNLYVADSSFMPTSLGINPSLTIAANALRVADKIAATLGV
jgi:choline dehydrogenase-like flavoprotein